MKLLFLADTHNCSESLYKWYFHSIKFDKIFVCGDFGLYGNSQKPLFYINGNHEDWQVVNAMDSGLLEFNNCKHIKTGELVHINGIVVTGLNGNYGKSRYDLNRKDKPFMFAGERARHYNYEDIETLKNLGHRVDILMAHETIPQMGLKRFTIGVGRKEITEVIDTVEPTYFFSGHHHTYKEVVYNDTKCIALGYAKDMGYCIECNGREMCGYPVFYDNKEYMNYIESRAAIFTV